MQKYTNVPPFFFFCYNSAAGAFQLQCLWRNIFFLDKMWINTKNETFYNSSAKLKSYKRPKKVEKV